MLDDKWQETLDRIRDNFEVEEEFDGEVENIPNATFKGIIFESPMGKIKIVRTKRPKVLDKKTQYSNRAGSEMRVEYIYSQDEFVDDLEISKWNDLQDDWVKSAFNL